MRARAHKHNTVNNNYIIIITINNNYIIINLNKRVYAEPGGGGARL